MVFSTEGKRSEQFLDFSSFLRFPTQLFHAVLFSIAKKKGTQLNQHKLYSPFHPDLDAALGVPGDGVVAGDDLVRPVDQAAGVLLHHHARQPL